MSRPPTVHMCSIHKTHCFPQRNHLRSSRRFLLRVRCPSAPSHTLYLVLLTQTTQKKKSLVARRLIKTQTGMFFVHKETYLAVWSTI